MRLTRAGRLASAAAGTEQRVAAVDQAASQRWLYSFGAFHAASAPTDSLMLVFASAVLGASPAMTGLLDGLGNLGIIGASVLLAIWLRPTGPLARLFVWALAGTGVALLAFAVVHEIVLALVLALVIGMLQGPPQVLGPLLAARQAPGRGSNPFVSLSRVGSVGGALGMAASGLWLAAAVGIVTEEMATRLFFAGMGSVVILGAWWAQVTLGRSARQFRLVTLPRRAVYGALSGVGGGGGRLSGRWPFRPAGQDRWRAGPRAPGRGPGGQPAGAGPIAAVQLPVVPGSALPARPPLLTDALMLYLAASVVLFVGLGMSFSAVHTLLASKLGAPFSLVMVAILAMRMLGVAMAGPAGQGRPYLFSMQSQSLAAAMRALSNLLIAVVALALSGPVAIALILVLIAFWGLSAGVFSVAGMQTVADLSMPGRWGQSQALYTTAINTGVVLGAWGGGVLAGSIGFAPMFFLAAALTFIAAIILLRS